MKKNITQINREVCLVCVLLLIASVVLVLPAAASMAARHSTAPPNDGDLRNFTSADKMRSLYTWPTNNHSTGNARKAGALVVVGLSLVVNTLGDLADSNIGDGRCDTDGNPGNGDQCSLRAAVQETSAAATDDAITFDPSLNGGTIILNSALADITGNLTLKGPGASLLTVQRSTAGATPSFRIFTINAGALVKISGLTAANGNAVGSSFPANSGGGILNDQGTLTMDNCVVSSSHADSAGGGIANRGTLTINNSTITNNTAVNSGAGVSNGSGATQTEVLTINNSTISNNITPGGGGGIFNIAHASITNSTISNNTAVAGGGINNANPMTLQNVTLAENNASNAGGGAFNPGIGTLTFGNTLIAGNTSPSGPDGSGANFVSQDYNLVGNTSGAQIVGTTTHNITNVNAHLGPLANNGGPTFTHDLRDGSPAIDAGNSSLTTDQRGQPRPIDDQLIANAAGGNASDIGAYEAPTFQVNSTADSDDGACALPGTGNGCTLREAINAANTTAGAELITFAPALTTGGAATVTLLTALPNLSSDMTITGPGANLLTVQRSTVGGTPNFRVFTISSGKTVTISGLTISNGLMTGINVRGGGVINNGTLTMNNCNVYGNSAPGDGGGGGGIYNDGPTLILNDCNIGGSGPGQPNTGGGLIHSGGTNGVFPNSGVLVINGGSIAGNAGVGLFILAPATVNRVAITENTGGGGVSVISNSTTNITNCLIANNINTTSSGGGLHNGLSTTNVVNTTISGNSATNSGGGIDSFNSNSLTLINVTVTNNRAGQGGGLVSTGSVLLKNTIVAGNFRGAGTTADDTQFLISPSSSFNIIGTCDGCGLTNGTNNNQVGVTNPGLAALADNGGPTKTHAPLAGSPALDAGNNSFIVNPPFAGPPFTDQRGNGFNRIVEGPDVDAIATVDIGAFEQQVALAEIADSSTNEDTQLIVSFDIGDRSTVTSVTATSSDSLLIPNDPEHLRITDAGSTEVITINPAANLSGTANITVTVNRTGGSASKTFALIVNSVNDVPSFTRGLGQTVFEDAGAQTVGNWATNISTGPADESAQTVSFQVTGNSNPSLFVAGPAISPTGTLTYTPAPNANGSATITITLKDNGGTANGGADTSVAQSFIITVNPVNDAPSFIKGPNQILNEDGGPQTITQWATGISVGPANESGQTVSFEVVNNFNPALFSAGPAIDPAGTLTYTTASNANGSASITIVMKDNGGTANGGQDTSTPQVLSITVRAVNDAPTFTKGPDQSVNNNAGLQAISNWATNLSAGPPDESSQTMGFLVTGNTNPGFFATAPSINSLGTLTYAPATNAGGTATITIALRDNGSLANGGQNTSTPQSFNINITPVGGFVQFSSAGFNTTESSGFATLTVKRVGDSSLPVTVDYASGGDSGMPCSAVNGAATPKCDFTAAYGTLNFGAGEDTKTLTVLISQDSYVEGSEDLSLTLSNVTGFAALGSQRTAVLTISDDMTEPATNPIDDAGNFVRQHYHDFLGREADQTGLDYWTGQLTLCGSDQTCLRLKRIDVSNAFFYELEYQQTGAYVYRIYRAAFGNNQPFPNPIPDAANPGEERKVLAHQVFAQDRARVVGGSDLVQSQLSLANSFVQRPEFSAKYSGNLSGPEFVDAVLTTIRTDIGADLTSQRQALIDLFNQAGGGNAGRGAVVYRLADDNAQTNPINNRAYIDAEYNRAFVATQYFGYLRRDPDMAGFLFWLGQVSSAPLRDVSKQHAMVCSFITSAEYQQRFSSITSHSNAECQ